MSSHDKLRKPKTRHGLTVRGLSCYDIKGGMDGDRIKAILHDRKMTQRKLAELAGYSENYLSKMLNDAPTHPFTDDAALRLGPALDMDPWELKADFSGITPEEEKLIRAYRQIHRDKRGEILEMILRMLGFASRSNAA